jgi:AraC-like DNA-binding protein
MGIFTIIGSQLLGLAVKEGAQAAREKILVGGTLYVILGLGLIVFAYLHALRYRRDRLKEKMLNIIESRGKVNLKLLASELKVSSKTLEALIYEVVGEKRFRGYIDWRAGEIFMDTAIKMESNRCPTCGAFVEMVGKDLVKCQYCGTETFL